VSTAQTILLGAIAGFTILLGLPLGRVPIASRASRAFLNALSAGILVFLLVDILAHATEPVEEAMTQATAGEAAWNQFAGLALVYALGFGAGLLGLLYAVGCSAGHRHAVPVPGGRVPRSAASPGTRRGRC
jgi:ZIP family zinc transporter